MLKNIGIDNIPFLLREKTIIPALNVPGSEISSFNIKRKFKKTLESLRRDKNFTKTRSLFKIIKKQASQLLHEHQSVDEYVVSIFKWILKFRFILNGHNI